MPWLEFSVEATQSDAEAFEDFLLEQGAHAVTIRDLKDQAIFEPAIGSTPLWQLNLIIGLFDTNLNDQRLFQSLQEQFGKQAPESYRLESLEDRDWQREWLKHYKSMCFGDRLWIVPSDNLLDTDTLPKEIAPEHVVLKMDPGLAFGTGTHETTSLCLDWLAQSTLQNKTLIDYGCGSGILGIAGHLLGAKQVFGCDLDPQAIIASHENARRNDIQQNYLMESVEGFNTTIEQHIKHNHQAADVVIANILAGPLEELCPVLANLLGSGGIIVLSGILKEQAEPLSRTYSQFFDALEIKEKNDWIRIVGVKR